MPSMNKVLLMGNITRDPQARFTPGGLAVCELGLAVNRRWVGTDGQDREETCFVDIDVWGKQAETCQQNLHKGSPVLVEGRLRMDQWEDRQTKQKRSKLKVVAERVQFLGAMSRRPAEGGAPGAGPGPGPEGGAPPEEGGPAFEEDGGDTGSSIPF